MDNGKMTIEQLRAIERWENEGGRVSRAVSIILTSQMEISRNVEPAPTEVIVPRKKRPGKNVDVWPIWSMA